MRLIVPGRAPRLVAADIYGKSVVVGAAEPNRRVLLSFFRDPACPFCNLRIYELTHHHKALSALGLDVVAVFKSTPEEVKRFVARQPRPFRVVADPDSRAYDAYGIEQSLWGKLKGIVMRLPTALKGLRIVGLAGLKTSNLMPADFLIDGHGNIMEAHYGNDAGDRIPMERIELFLARGLVSRTGTARAA